MRLYKFLNEKREQDVSLKKLNQWKKDLKRMTKLYRSLETDSTSKTIKQFDKVNKYFITFRQNWEKWYMQELLGKEKKIGNEDSYLKKDVRVAAWQAEMAIINLFPDTWDYKKDKDVSAPWLLDEPRYRGDSRKNKIIVYQKAFKKAFDIIKKYIEQESENIKLLKDTEQYNIAGINVLISGLKEKGDDWKEKEVKPFLQTLPKAVNMIKKSGLDLTLKGLTIELTLSGAKSVGVQSGAGGSYNFSTDWLRIYPLGMTGKGDSIKTFVHELGHRYYYRNLKEKVREVWDKTIRKRQVQIKNHHIDDFFGKYVGDIQNEKLNKEKILKLIKNNEQNPTISIIYIYLIHNFPTWHVNQDEDKKVEYIKKMKKWYTKEWIDLEFISDYAATKSNEAFAEVFAYWVTDRKRLGEWTRAFFKEIVSTGGSNIREERNNLKKHLTNNKNLNIM